MGALLLHHPGHGGQRHQGRHQEEEDGEHLGDGLHLGGVAAEAREADVSVPVQHVPLRLADIRDFLLGVLDVGLRVGQLFVRLRLGLVVFRLSVGQLLPGVGQLFLVGRDFRPPVVQFLLGVGQLFLVPGNLRRPVVQLLLRRRKGLLRLGLPGGQGGLPGGQLLLAGRQRPGLLVVCRQPRLIGGALLVQLGLEGRCLLRLADGKQIGDGFLRLGDLRGGLVQCFLRVGQGRLSCGQLVFALPQGLFLVSNFGGVGRSLIRQFLLAVGQLPLRVGQGGFPVC